MSEAVDDMLEGRTCQCCGEFLDEYLMDDDFDGHGYPVSCEGCKDELED